MLTPLLALGFGPMEMTFVAVIGLLLFGKRLPEVAKGLGRSVVEFKRGLAGIDEDIRKPAAPPEGTPPGVLTPPPAAPQQPVSNPPAPPTV